MEIKEKTSNVVEILDSSPLDPALVQELEELDSQEQQVLCELLKRIKRDRAVNGQIDELAIAVNGLKDYPKEDDWMFLQKLNEKIAPDLHKEFVDVKKIKLETKFSPITESISEVINRRASIRDFNGTALSLEKLSTLLDQSCGVRDTILAYNRRDVALRNFPSAGGLQCTEFYLVVNRVEGVSQGLYHHNPMQKCLEQIEKGNFRWRVADCCSQHEWLAEANVVIFIASNLSRLIWKYGAYKSYRLSHLETGVVSQNLHLVATALELGSCMVFGFDDELTNSLLGLDGRQEFTALLIAIGNKVNKKSISTKFANGKDR